MTTSGVTASYGSYRFKPVPLATMAVEHFKTASRTIGGYYSLTLNGTLYPKSTGGGEGAKNLFEEKNRLMSGLNVDYDEFLINFESASPTCAGTSVYGRPRVRSVSFAESPDNWTDRMPYTIELEFTSSSITGVADYISKPRKSDYGLLGKLCRPHNGWLLGDYLWDSAVLRAEAPSPKKH